MAWQVPGTLLTCDRREVDQLETQLTYLPSLGGLTLRNIVEITGLEDYTVQNWVKRGFLPAPQNRRYTVDQLCRIILINMLKGVFPMERICQMLSMVNGRLDDTADDIIPDSQLYFMFVRLAARAKELDNDPDSHLDRELDGYVEPYPGAQMRIRQVLKIMLTGYVACRMRTAAENQLDELLKGVEKDGR